MGRVGIQRGVTGRYKDARWKRKSFVLEWRSAVEEFCSGVLERRRCFKSGEEWRNSVLEWRSGVKEFCVGVLERRPYFRSGGKATTQVEGGENEVGGATTCKLVNC